MRWQLDRKANRAVIHPQVGPLAAGRRRRSSAGLYHSAVGCLPRARRCTPSTRVWRGGSPAGINAMSDCIHGAWSSHEWRRANWSSCEAPFGPAHGSSALASETLGRGRFAETQGGPALGRCATRGPVGQGSGMEGCDHAVCMGGNARGASRVGGSRRTSSRLPFAWRVGYSLVCVSGCVAVHLRDPLLAMCACLPRRSPVLWARHWALTGLQGVMRVRRMGWQIPCSEDRTGLVRGKGWRKIAKIGQDDVVRAQTSLM